MLSTSLPSGSLMWRAKEESLLVRGEGEGRGRGRGGGEDGERTQGVGRERGEKEERGREREGGRGCEDGW